ncbi:hypothetical protein CK210_04155 [Vibrio anguillarum]|uniref:hypothetical protein n=1 Tax=Vibrio anguillarum TaxID=55601 RepID=UPI000CA25905|nr:hypothetical protein [Vibrio anguillarum]AUB86512.1 hypothetical protein CKY00_04150 [Vibrio anguillarum]AUB89951.1 hypothetical protein CKX99_04155 [Vibrio anguillarum]AUB93393.1 hypothetical protein CK210_04155 [Vibrio anguillarum]AUB96824.1 hypothetical protein CK209_04150 [Vibrio anguillarum]
MENEWAEVVNNLIKIGLPSLVTGVVTVLGVKHNAKATHDKFFIEHKTKVLEKISDEVDEYFDSWEMVYSKIGAILKHKDHDLDEVKLTENQIQAIVERDKELIVSWSKKKSSLSKLRLLGADEAANRLKDCGELEKQLRDMMFFEKEYPNYNQLNCMRKEARTAQEKFHTALSKFYGRPSR